MPRRCVQRRRRTLIREVRNRSKLANAFGNPVLLGQKNAEQFSYDLRELLQAFEDFEVLLDRLMISAKEAVNQSAVELRYASHDLVGTCHHLRHHIQAVLRATRRLHQKSRLLSPFVKMSDRQLCTADRRRMGKLRERTQPRGSRSASKSGKEGHS